MTESSASRQWLGRLFAVSMVLLWSGAGWSAELAPAEGFESRALSFLKAQCVDCHSGAEPDASLDLSGFQTSGDVVRHFAVWDLIVSRVSAGEMPPQEAASQPTAAEVQQFLEWTASFKAKYAERHAGDPGPVLARRLTAAEYDYTIRDLTGVDIQPAAEFPVDPANTAGFDNSGESLLMTPALLTKYLSAARTVSEHLVFTPHGLAFAEHSVITDTDRDKYCVRRIIDFYDRQDVDLAHYFLGIWELKQGDPADGTVDEMAKLHNLSAKYLQTLYNVYRSKEQHIGPLAVIRERLRSLPDERDAAELACRELAEDVALLRQRLVFDFPHLKVDGINRGSQPLVLWRNRQLATHRQQLNREALEEILRPSEAEKNGLIQGLEEVNEEVVAGFEKFCELFPDRFYVDRRGRAYVGHLQEAADNEGQYRLLSAGFHSMMGYFRDDQPLCHLLLTPEQQGALSQLWFELDFIANVPERQHAGFIWFERAEGRYLTDAVFDEFRSEDKSSTTEVMIERLRVAYLEKARQLGANDVEQQAMQDYFTEINLRIRAVETAREAAEEQQLEDLFKLAERAYRRPLPEGERESLLAFYREIRERDGLSHETAVRDTFVSILMSPYFCYRAQPSERPEPIHPLDDYELASRLSYFLWSSLPDEELLRCAEQGLLQDSQILRQQVRRLLQSPQARGLALEFGGNWLGFRHFLTHTGVDRERFPQFDNELQQAMFEEPIRFTLDVVQQNRSVLDFLYAQHTFVNKRLAEHYDIQTDLAYGSDGWTKVDALPLGRGGVLPMAVFLTKNSPGLRTSPVKRGFWVVQQLLGTHIPAPPPNVPELPNDESQLQNLTLREVLAKHREHPSCAGCHVKFDSFGLAFEGFGPIGERRNNDLAGNPVDVVVDFPDGTNREGISGLKAYLQAERQDQFLETLTRKMLTYACGRSLIVSDEPLIQDILNELSSHDYQFHTLIEAIVLSPQFRHQRGTTFMLTDD